MSLLRTKLNLFGISPNFSKVDRKQSHPENDTSTSGCGADSREVCSLNNKPTTYICVNDPFVYQKAGSCCQNKSPRNQPFLGARFVGVGAAAFSACPQLLHFRSVLVTSFRKICNRFLAKFEKKTFCEKFVSFGSRNRPRYEVETEDGSTSTPLSLRCRVHSAPRKQIR